MSLEVELIDAQRIRMEGLLRRHQLADYRGALLAQISSHGQSMRVIYLEPPERKRLKRLLERIDKERKAREEQKKITEAGH